MADSYFGDCDRDDKGKCKPSSCPRDSSGHCKDDEKTGKRTATNESNSKDKKNKPTTTNPNALKPSPTGSTNPNKLQPDNTTNEGHDSKKDGGNKEKPNKSSRRQLVEKAGEALKNEKSIPHTEKKAMLQSFLNVVNGFSDEQREHLLNTVKEFKWFNAGDNDLPIELQDANGVWIPSKQTLCLDGVEKQSWYERLANKVGSAFSSLFGSKVFERQEINDHVYTHEMYHVLDTMGVKDEDLKIIPDDQEPKNSNERTMHELAGRDEEERGMPYTSEDIELAEYNLESAKKGTRHSATNAWKDIFNKELSGNQLSEYASTSAIESFAEFGRAANHIKDITVLEKRFPLASKYFKENKLWKPN